MVLKQSKNRMKPELQTPALQAVADERYFTLPAISAGKAAF